MSDWMKGFVTGALLMTVATPWLAGVFYMLTRKLVDKY